MKKATKKAVCLRLSLCLTIVAATVLALLVLPGASASFSPMNATTDGLVFTANGNGYSITDYLGTTGDVLIPSEHQGEKVTFLSATAFSKVVESGDGPIILPPDWFYADGIVRVNTITFESKDIVIEDSASTLPENIVLYGYQGSTAQAYAQAYDREFITLPEIRSASLALGSDIALHYRVVLPEGMTDAVMHFTVSDREEFISPVATDEANVYVYVFDGLTPQMMGQSVGAELLVDNVKVAEKASYSIREYCLNMLNRISAGTLQNYSQEQLDALSTLLADTLEYGARVQIYRDYFTDDLVNVGVTGQTTFTTIGDEYELKKPLPSTADNGTSFIGATTTLNHLIYINFIVRTKDINRVSLQFDNITYTAEDFKRYPSLDNYGNSGLPAYVVTAPAIYALDIDTVYSVSLCEDGVPCQSLDYGVITYLHSKQDDTDEKLRLLIQAVRNYGLSADAYREATSLALVKNGTSEYRVVYSASAGSDVVAAANELVYAIERTTGVSLTAVPDTTANDGTAKELLIGSTNRSASTDVTKSLGATEYAIAAKGQHIVLAGGSDNATVFAVREFLRQYAGYTSEDLYTPVDKITVAGTTYTTGVADISSHVALYVTDDSLSYLSDLERSIGHVSDTLTVYPIDASLDTVFDAGRAGLVVVAGANQLPTGAKAAITNYMNEKGRVLFLGGPLFEDELVKYNDQWVTIEDALADMESGTSCLKRADLVTFKRRYTYIGDWTAVQRVAPSGYSGSTSYVSNTNTSIAGGENYLTATLDDVSHYHTVRWDVSKTASDGDAISFWAKANDANTTKIGVELTEKTDDQTIGWAAVIELTQSWTKYTIPAYEFKPYTGTPATATPNFNNITKIAIGYTQEYCKGSGTKTFSVGAFDLCYHGYSSGSKLEKEPALSMGGFAPMEELYPVTEAAKGAIAAYEGQIFVKDRDYVLPDEVYSCYAQRQSLGYTKDWSSRFVPLIEITDSRGLRSGYAAWMKILTVTDTYTDSVNYRGSILACFSAVSEDFYDASGIAAVTETVKVLTQDAFLVEGGVDEYTYIEPDQTTYLAGAVQTTLRNNDASALQTLITLYSGDEVLTQYTADQTTYTTNANGVYRNEKQYSFSDGKPTYVTVSLLKDGEEIDRIGHEINYWSPKPVSERDYIYTEDGYFKQDGKTLYFYGVNFGPSYRAGFGNSGNWYCNKGYDPTVIEDDLLRLKDIGINAVAIWTQLSAMRDGNALVDFIRRCDELGIYVDLSIDGDAGFMYPLKATFKPNEVIDCMNRLHIADFDNIIAYDIAWEQRVGTYLGAWSTTDEENGKNLGFYPGRKNWDDEWAAWIDVQYGSLANAQTAWGVTLSKTEAGYPYVSNDMMDSTNTKYDKVMDAYYRFIDDIVAREMNDGVALFRDADPNHLFSFRMSMAGSVVDPFYTPSIFCFDFQSLASTMDVMEPEGYWLGSEYDQIHFATEYARYAAPDTPVVWKEFGADIWTGSNFIYNESKDTNAGAHYENILSRCLDANVSGVFAWWSISGYRIDENNNSAIWNPDGSDCKITEVMRKYADDFINQGEFKQPEVLITIDRDNNLGGVSGIYNATISQIKNAVNAGKSFALVDASTSNGNMVYADTVYTQAVGGATGTGTYPLRYVNGMVKDVTVVEKNGQKVALITVCNTKQTIWRSGTVSLISTSGSSTAVDVTINQDVNYLEDVVLEVPVNTGTLNLRFEIQNVAFGPLYTTTIR